MRNQQGNALLYVLIAVALFAALSFAVSHINKNANVGNLTKEQTKLLATDIVEYTRAVKNAVQVMRANGVAEDDYCFHTSLLEYNSYEIDACSVEDNQVFSPLGGAINYRFAEKSWLDPQHSKLVHFGEFVFSGRVSIPKVGRSDNDDLSQELIVYLPYIDESVCNQINENLGLQNNPPPADDFEGLLSSAVKRYGHGGDSFSVSASAVIGDNNTVLEGVKAGCVLTNENQYYFYYVLLSR